MNFLKRAALAVTRKKGRSIIMFVLFAAIANMVLAGLAIRHATEYAGASARQKLGGELTLAYDMQSALQKSRTEQAAGGERIRIQSEPVTEAMAQMIASDKDIASYNYIVNTNGLAQDFEPVSTGDGTSSDGAASGGGADNNGRGGNQFGQGQNFVMPDVTVTGVSATGLLNEFKNDQSTLVSGRQITAEDAGKKSAMIEKNLAEQNGLNVGSTISVKAAGSDTVEQYTVVGIYQAAAADASSDGPGMRNFSFAQPYNRIYVDYSSAIPLKTTVSDDGTTTPGGIDSVVFNVDDPQNIDAVLGRTKTMDIDWSKFTLDANDAAYKQMVGPIENVASFAMTAIYIVAIAGAIILGLILMLAVKERMYETGVLLSMGESKMKILAQYISEVLIIAVLAFGFSMFTGKFIAQDVGSTLLSNEISSQQTQTADNGPGGGSGGGFGNFAGRQFGQFRDFIASGFEPIDSINVQITAAEVGQMSLAGLIILLAGTVLPAANVMRYKPKAILTKAT